ncbi:MAG: carboxymuconolactone decarboxylase family protein [Actinomycetota bacterium]
MRIEPVSRETAPPIVQRIFESIEKAGGTVSNVFRMLAHKPDVLRAYNQLSGAIWADGALSARTKELAYLRTSIQNGCEFCAQTHTESGKRRGLTDEQVGALKEPGGRRREDVFSEEDRAVLRFTELLTSRPGNIDQIDLDELGRCLSQEQIIELVTVIATANWTNRVNEGLRTPL